MKNFVEKYLEAILFTITSIISVSSFLFFFSHGQRNLIDYDSIARLNIARKIIDSLTPGFGQLGGIWLPFPQVLMLPFIWNTFFWHTGLAGGYVSMVAFIFAAIYIYKTGILLFDSKRAAFFSWLVFVTNINILFLQSSAMSESFFIFTMVLAIYFLTLWGLKGKIFHLIAAAFFVCLATLTRYEGYIVFFASMVSVLILSAIKFPQKRSRIEGTIVLFGTLAILGIVIWAIYCAALYNDPFYWLHLYSGATVNSKSQLLSTENLASLTNVSRAHSLITSTSTYTWALALMSGLLVFGLAMVGMLSIISAKVWQIFQKKIVIAVIPLVLVFFLLLVFFYIGLSRGLIPSIEVPPLAFSSLHNKALNFSDDANIRYGIILLPFMAWFIGYLGKRKIFTVIITVIVVAQLYTNFATPLFLIFQIPVKLSFSAVDQSARNEGAWLQNHYTGGLILVSANRHEDVMFYSNLPYKDFIYEGASGYWETSLESPSKYASWIIMDNQIKGDAVTDNLNQNLIVQNNFIPVYSNAGFVIYHIVDPKQNSPSAINGISHSWGTWISFGKTVYYVLPQGLIGVPTYEIFLSNGGDPKEIAPGNSGDRDLLNKSQSIPLMSSEDARTRR